MTGECVDRRQFKWLLANFLIITGAVFFAVLYGIQTRDLLVEYQNVDLEIEAVQNFNTAALLWLYYDSEGIKHSEAMVLQMQQMCRDLKENTGVCEEAFEYGR